MEKQLLLTAPESSGNGDGKVEAEVCQVGGETRIKALQTWIVLVGYLCGYPGYCEAFFAVA